MNILFLYNGVIDPEKGGIQRVTSVLADYFEGKGHTVWYLSLDFYKKETPHPRRQLMFPDSRSLDAVENMVYWENILLEKHIDIVINQSAQDPKSSKLMRIAKKRCKIFSVHHTAPLGKILNFEAVYADRFKGISHIVLFLSKYRVFQNLILNSFIWKYRNHYLDLCDASDYFVLLSNEFKPEFSRLIGKVLPKNVIAISNPVSFQDAYQYDSDAKIKEVLFVGRISNSEKRVDLLLKVWQRICKKYPDWKLTIVGNGNDMSRMEALANELDLENYSFEGYKAPKEYYKRASLFCMTSSFEGFGIVLVEAMHYGVVPLAFNSYASVTDIIHDRGNGFLVNPFDVEEYAKTMELLIENESLREKVALNAINSSKRFSVENIGEKWLSLFNE